MESDKKGNMVKTKAACKFYNFKFALECHYVVLKKNTKIVAMLRKLVFILALATLFVMWR